MLLLMKAPCSLSVETTTGGDHLVTSQEQIDELFA